MNEKSLMIDVRKIKILEDTFENSGDYGIELNIRIYYAQNNHLSRNEIANILKPDIQTIILSS